MNLLRETVAEIERNGYTSDDVTWIGSRDGEYVCTWDEFIRLANVEYDNGYGGQRVACDLIVRLVGGAWLERHEYDGSEHWVYRAPFTTSGSAKRIDRVVEDDDHGSAYEGLAALHHRESE